MLSACSQPVQRTIAPAHSAVLTATPNLSTQDKAKVFASRSRVHNVACTVSSTLSKTALVAGNEAQVMRR